MNLIWHCYTRIISLYASARTNLVNKHHQTSLTYNEMPASPNRAIAHMLNSNAWLLRFRVQL